MSAKYFPGSVTVPSWIRSNENFYQYLLLGKENDLYQELQEEKEEIIFFNEEAKYGELEELEKLLQELQLPFNGHSDSFFEYQEEDRLARWNQKNYYVLCLINPGSYTVYLNDLIKQIDNPDNLVAYIQEKYNRIQVTDLSKIPEPPDYKKKYYFERFDTKGIFVGGVLFDHEHAFYGNSLEHCEQVKREFILQSL